MMSEQTEYKGGGTKKLDVEPSMVYTLFDTYGYN